MSGNVKLSYWVGDFSKASNVVRCATFVVFWLCKFIFDSHPYYAVKPLYFCLAIKIFARVSLPQAPMFLGYLYVQLDILQQVGSYHIVTTFSTVPYCNICCGNVVPSIWLSASPSVLPKRSIGLVRRLLLIFVVLSFLIFRWLTTRLG